MELKESSAYLDAPLKQTTSPIVTGSSVLAVKYCDGIMMMADTLGSYGGLAMFRNLRRINSVTPHCLIGASGEYSDYQYILKLIDRLNRIDFTSDDNSHLTPENIYSYLTRIMYNRRSKIDPLWNILLVGGVENDKFFLGAVDLYGSSYSADSMATGYGQHLALPLLRKYANPTMNYEQAKNLLEDCQRILLYRDCRTLNFFTLATVTKEGATISEPYSLETKWDFKRFINPMDNL